MRTQVMQEVAIETPWLEFDPHSGPIEKTPLESFPFMIGRQGSADLRINSNKVSREHAVISKCGKSYQVQDLGSTNGTFVNGEQITHATLNDGDLLAIAEVEFVFFCGAANAARQTATMRSSQLLSPTHDSAWETIVAVRRLHEVVTHGCLRTLFQPIVELPAGEPFGYEAFATSGIDGTGQTRCEPLAFDIECRATDRVRQLFRRLAAEESLSLPPGYLFLAITVAECAQPSLVDHLCQLRSAMGTSRQLVIEVPDSEVVSTTEFRALLACLREARIQVAYDGYASGGVQITERAEITPDFLKLAPSMFRSIHRGIDRQRQVQLIVHASHDIGRAVIATGIDNEADLRVCRDLGCTLAQGDLFGPPQPLSSLISMPRSPSRLRKPAR